jgi:hypothetical protein
MHPWKDRRAHLTKKIVSVLVQTRSANAAADEHKVCECALLYSRLTTSAQSPEFSLSYVMANPPPHPDKGN